jgi:F420-dependent oxidoreductase-like protein
MKLGVTLPYTDRIPLEMLVPFVQAADRLGYESIWVPEAYGWDGFTILARLACATQRIKLATGIVNVFSRSPALLGQSAASMDMITKGRFILGLGTSGHQVISGWHGVPFEKGVKRLGETIDIVRLVVARQPVLYEGEVFRLDKGLKLMTHPVRPQIPVYVATLTPTGIALAGEKADGWLPVFFSAEHYERVLKPHLIDGAKRAGRDVRDVAVCVFGMPVVVTDDIERGRDSVRPHLALYIGGMGSREKNYYNRLFRSYGFEEEAARIQELYLDGKRKEAMAALTEEMIDTVSIVGPVEHCRAELRKLETCGIDEVAIALSTPDNDPMEIMRALEAIAA